MTELIAGVFTVAVLGTTIWLCRGLRLASRDICLAGLMSAATLVLRCFLITLPNGSHISLGAMLPILLLSLIGDLSVCQVVDPLLTARVALRKGIFRDLAF